MTDATKSNAHDAPTRRDLVLRTPEAVGLLATLAAIWPLIGQMRPRADHQVDIDVTALKPGEQITVKFRGAPIFIRRLTKDDIDAAQSVALDELKDDDARNANRPAALATLANRLVDSSRNILIMKGVCTHLGCVPVSNAGDFGGWFCPCHGAHFDTAGRIRKGPAPENLAVPLASFVDEVTVRLK